MAAKGDGDFQHEGHVVGGGRFKQLKKQETRELQCGLAACCEEGLEQGNGLLG